MRTNRAQLRFAKPGLTSRECIFVICGISLVAVFAIFFGPSVNYRGSDRSANILNIRNCQQAMRGHANMHGLNAGDSFTREDLEYYMKFPTAPGGLTYIPGTQITGQSADPAVNGDHLWLRVVMPDGESYLGELGFKDIAETTDW